MPVATGWKEATELWIWASPTRPWWTWRAAWRRSWRWCRCPETCQPSSDTCWLKERSSTAPTARYSQEEVPPQDVSELGRQVGCDDSCLTLLREFFFCFTLQGPLEQRNELGIMFRHAYSLTAVERVRLIFDTSSRAFTFWCPQFLEWQSGATKLKTTLKLLTLCVSLRLNYRLCVWWSCWFCLLRLTYSRTCLINNKQQIKLM